MPPRIASVVLDNEAVVALSSTDHPKHREVLPFVVGVSRRRARDSTLRVYVPVAVRIEAGWDRSAPAAAVANLVTGAVDVPLDEASANEAARLRASANVSVIDATVAVVASHVPHPVAILTSGTADMDRLAAQIGGDVRVIRV